MGSAVLALHTDPALEIAPGGIRTDTATGPECGIDTSAPLESFRCLLQVYPGPRLGILRSLSYVSPSSQMQ